MPLTAKHQRFCELFLVDLNATKAAEGAGFSARRARQTGSELLQREDVQAELVRLRAKQTERTQIDADAVLRLWWMKATADPNELIEYRRACCRHCYGADHRYQRTADERARAVLALREGETLDEMGGVGFDARRPPAAGCPECFGEGVERVHPKDTRALSPAARALYAGVKLTKEGLEVKMHDQDAALANVARHLGMFVARIETRDKTAEEQQQRGADARARLLAELERRRATAAASPPPTEPSR